MSEQKPAFDGPGPERVFHDALAQGRFTIQQCADCRKFIFYPRVVCPHCGSARQDWVEPTGAGSVYSCTTVRRKADEGGDYNVSLIDLREGPRLMSRVEDIAPEKIAIGMAVEARVRLVDGTAVLIFVPTKAGEA